MRNKETGVFFSLHFFSKSHFIVPVIIKKKKTPLVQNNTKYTLCCNFRGNINELNAAFMRRNVSSCINFVLRSKSPTTKYWCSARLPSLTNAVMTIRKYFFFFFTCPIFFANKLYSMWFQGEDNVEYYLGLTPTGVIVLRNKNIVANYYWWVHNVFVSNSFSRLGYIADETVFLFFIFNLFPVFFKIFDSIKKNI